jgi:hypothetical protein
VAFGVDFASVGLDLGVAAQNDAMLSEPPAAAASER